MAFLTNDKLTIVGAAGMIGSNMVQTALMMGLTNDICLYDVFSPEGVAEEMRQSGFGDVKITATTDAKEAFTNAKYIISSGGAPRKAGMTREDLAWARTSRSIAPTASTWLSSSTLPTSLASLLCFTAA